MLTTIILMGGFGVLMFSSFRDVQDIGTLTTLLLLFALLADLFLCPKLILNRMRKGQPHAVLTSKTKL